LGGDNPPAAVGEPPTDRHRIAVGVAQPASTDSAVLAVEIPQTLMQKRESAIAGEPVGPVEGGIEDEQRQQAVGLDGGDGGMIAEPKPVSVPDNRSGRLAVAEIGDR
jgi:hypothetical protein